MTHEDYKELLALEASGAPDPGERAALDAHLSACAECRAELDELREAAASLAYTVAPVAPPRELRANILERVRAYDPSEAKAFDPSEAKSFDPSEAKAFDPSEALPKAGGPPRAARALEDLRGLVKGLSLWQLFSLRPSLGFGAAAAAFAVVALAVASLSLWGRASELRAEVARLTERLGESEGELARGRGQLAQMREVNDLLSAPQTRLATLAGTKTSPRARGHIAFDPATGRALLVAHDLPPAPEGKAYQLWFIAEGKPLPGGVFKTDAAGGARMTDRMTTQPATPLTFAVTLEEERGVQTPKGEMYLLSAAS